MQHRAPIGNRRKRSDRGAVIPITAMLLTVLIGMTSFAVDLGRLRSERRSLQADADAIAMDAVQALNGHTAPDGLVVALAEANASAVRNHLGQVLTSEHVQVGAWDVASQSFVPMTGAKEIPTAVQVDLRSTIPMYFDLSAEERSVNRLAVAVSRATTRGELGSVLAGVETYVPSAPCSAALAAQMSFMNRIYSTFFSLDVEGGVSASTTVDTGLCPVTSTPRGLRLDALSWQGLALADVDLNEVAALMGLGSAADLFNGDVQVGPFLEATGQALEANPNVAHFTFDTMFLKIAQAVGGSTTMNLANIVDLGTGDGSAASTSINALQLFTSTAMLINNDNLVDVTLPVDIPPATQINTTLSVVEPPRTHTDYRSAGQLGPRTSQVRAVIEVPLASLPLSYSLLGLSLQNGPVQGTLKVIVETARADSVYEDVTCATTGNDDATVRMGVDTGAVTVSFGHVEDQDLLVTADELNTDGTPPPLTILPTDQLDNELAKLSLLGLVLASFELSAVTDVSASVNALGATSAHTFAGPYGPTEWHRYPGGVSGTDVSSTLAVEAYSKIEYKEPVDLLSILGLQSGDISQMLEDALMPVVDQLGTEVIDPLLASLGATAAGADGRIIDVQCQVPALANQG